MSPLEQEKLVLYKGEVERLIAAVKITKGRIDKMFFAKPKAKAKAKAREETGGELEPLMDA